MNVTLSLTTLDPPAGNVFREGVGARSFMGWLELLRVLSEIFTAPGAHTRG